METMAKDEGKIFFSTFEVKEQVFLTTRHSFALVNLKPLLPGHVLVCPFRKHRRLTDLSAEETTDLFNTVQRVQRLLARLYFGRSREGGGEEAEVDGHHDAAGESKPAGAGGAAAAAAAAVPEDGSFNIAIQDGVGAGQTVPHVHVHVIPRIRDVNAKDPSGEGDVLYDMMAREEGNVGGALWDRDAARSAAAAGAAAPSVDGPGAAAVGGSTRPVPGGSFPLIEDCHREARSTGEMAAEADVYRKMLQKMDSSGPNL